MIFFISWFFLLMSFYRSIPFQTSPNSVYTNYNFSLLFITITTFAQCVRLFLIFWNQAGRDVLSTTRAHSYQQGKDDRTGFRIACSRLSGTTGPLPYVPSDGVVSALTGWSIHASNLRHVPSGIFTIITTSIVTQSTFQLFDFLVCTVWACLKAMTQ